MVKKLIKDITDIERMDLDAIYVRIDQSERYLDIVKDMSDFIDSLDMPFLERCRLINKMVEYDKAVRYDAMFQTLADKIHIETKEKD